MASRSVHALLDREREGNRLGKAFDAGIVVLIVVSVVVAVFETDQALTSMYGSVFATVEVVAGVVFTAEYLLRLWACVEDRRWRPYNPLTARLRYALTPLALIDLLAALPFWLTVFTVVPFDALWLMRTSRVLKLLRYSAAFEVFGTVIFNERRSLLSAMTIMATLLVLVSSLIYLVEREAQPDRFGTLPETMWWGIVTLTTVGYGDVVPITGLGRLIGGFAVILGMGMFALPAGILASGFVEETRRRSFMVTWNLVASVPFFQNLPASRIADIAAMLRPRVAVKGETIVEKGEPGDCMYFIVSGEVEVQVPPRPVRLPPGEFFGEIALLTAAPRTATVVAATTCQLLVLRVADFKKLMASNDDLREAISHVAEQRLAASAAARAAPTEPAERH